MNVEVLAVMKWKESSVFLGREVKEVSCEQFKGIFELGYREALKDIGMSEKTIDLICKDINEWRCRGAAINLNY